MLYPIHGVSISTGLVGAFLFANMSADVFIGPMKTSFFYKLRASPRFPIVVTTAFSTLATSITWFFLINQRLLLDESPCPSCYLSAALGVAIGNAVFAAVSMPLVLHQWALSAKAVSVEAFNHIEILTLIHTYCKPIYRYVPYIIAVQGTIAAAAIYSMLWARERILESVDVSPELVKDVMERKVATGLLDRISIFLENMLAVPEEREVLSNIFAKAQPSKD